MMLEFVVLLLGVLYKQRVNPGASSTEAATVGSAGYQEQQHSPVQRLTCVPVLTDRKQRPCTSGTTRQTS